MLGGVRRARAMRGRGAQPLTTRARALRADRTDAENETITPNLDALVKSGVELDQYYV